MDVEFRVPFKFSVSQFLVFNQANRRKKGLIKLVRLVGCGGSRIGERWVKRVVVSRHSEKSLCQLAGVRVTHHHKLGSLKMAECILSQCQKSKVQIQMPAWPGSL